MTNTNLLRRLLSRAGGAATLVCVLVLGGQVSAQVAAGTPPSADPTLQALDDVQANLLKALAPSADVVVDTDVLAAAQAMVQALRPRIQTTLKRWLDEELLHKPDAPWQSQVLAVVLRAHNELALWQLDSRGPEHDSLRWQAQIQPRRCDVQTTSPTVMDRLVLTWQQLPPPQRAGYLAAEAAALQRWGEPRDPVPARPVPTVDEQAWQQVDALARGGASAAVALPPLLAWRLLVRQPDEDVRRNLTNLCLLRQWSLRAALSQGALSDEQSLAHRYASLPQARDWYDDTTDPADATAYPAAANRLGIEGEVGVALTVDGKGKLVRAAIVDRDLTVPGIRGQRPVLFDTMLDDASLARAAALPPQAPAADQLKDGVFTRQVRFAFRLQ